MARALGRSAVILVGTSDPPATPLSYISNPEVDEPPQVSDETTNDDGAGMRREYVRKDYKLRVQVKADPADAGQTIIRNARKNLTKVWVIVREQGTGSGLAQDKGEFVVTGFKRGMPLQGQSTVDIELSISGTIDDTAQS